MVDAEKKTTSPIPLPRLRPQQDGGQRSPPNNTSVTTQQDGGQRSPPLNASVQKFEDPNTLGKPFKPEPNRRIPYERNSLDNPDHKVRTYT